MWILLYLTIAKKSTSGYTEWYMKVILLKDVPGTGKRGEIKEVADGYAHNFLIKKKLAEPASKQSVRSVQEKEAKKLRDNQKNRQRTEQMVSRLDGAEIEVSEKTNDEGRLYAAITAQKLSSYIQKKCGITVDPKQIIIEDPIKEIGDHRVRIDLGYGLEAELSVIVSD